MLSRGQKGGAKHTIARVRNPEYAEELNLFRDDLGLSMTVNPELACATEMARLVRVPSAMRVDTFARGRVELLKIQLSGNSPLVNHTLQELSARRYNVLLPRWSAGNRISIFRTALFGWRPEIGSPSRPSRRTQPSFSSASALQPNPFVML